MGSTPEVEDAEDDEKRNDDARAKEEIVAEMSKRCKARMPEIQHETADARDQVPRLPAEHPHHETDDQRNDDKLHQRAAGRIAEKFVHRIRHGMSPVRSSDKAANSSPQALSKANSKLHSVLGASCTVPGAVVLVA